MHRHRAGHGMLVRVMSAALFTVAVGGCGGGDEEQPPPDTQPVPSTQPPTTTAAASGADLYVRCATCHMADGNGMPGTYPPLAGSEYVNSANVDVPIGIVVHGLQGPVTVKGVEYNSVMPAFGTGVPMSDDEVAAVLTHVRSSWGNTGGPVTAQQVAAYKAKPRTASGPLTAAELQALGP